jgi:hypothetical protein
MNMAETSSGMVTLEKLREAAAGLPTSAARFPDGGQYRIEIPSVESPAAAEEALEEAARYGVEVHRLSQGSGVTLLTDDEIRQFAGIGAAHDIEICLFVGPRAPWDGYSASSLAGDGRNVGWRNVGVPSLAAARDDVLRAAELGIRSILIADEGLAALIGHDKQTGALPHDLVVKASALMGIANPIGGALLASLGFDSLNIPSDTRIDDLAAFRCATPAYLDLYIEAPDGLGGFMRYHDLGEIVRVAAPVYIKFGLRNAGALYPSGAHLEGLMRASARERVRRAAIGVEHLTRQYPEALPSPRGRDLRGVPIAAAGAPMTRP